MLLLSKGTDLHTVDNKGYSSLHYASKTGDVSNIKRFLNNGMNIDREAKDDRTPLMCATLAGQTDAASFLLSQGADRWANLQEALQDLRLCKVKC